MPFYRHLKRSDEIVPYDEMWPGRTVWGEGSRSERPMLICKGPGEAIPIEQHREEKVRQAQENSRRFPFVPSRMRTVRHVGHYNFAKP